MKKLHLLSLLTLSACSSSSQYERDAYMPRPAPTFDPMTDAPHTVGQPGYVNGQRTERSTNRRYAAPSKEPQMMAADGDDRRTVELMLTEAVPETTPEGIERADYAKCWKDFLKMANRERDALLRFSPEEVRCMRNRVLAHCGTRQVVKRAERAGEKYDPTFEDFMAGAVNRTACGKSHEFWTDRVANVINKFNQHGDDILGWQPSTTDRN